jgi:hypothetical protein
MYSFVFRILGCRDLTLLAWLIVGLHVIALALSAISIWPGSPLVPLPDRLTYLAGAPVGWALGWAVWMACAVALIAFLFAVSCRLGDSKLAQLGLTIAVVGAGFDLFCDMIFILIFPIVAARPGPDHILFDTVAQITAIASFVIANGAYSLAVPLFTIALDTDLGLPRVTTAAGFGVGACGLVLTVAGVTEMPGLLTWATPLTIGIFCAWVVLVARSCAFPGTRL